MARAGLAALSGTARPGRLLCAAALAAVTGEHPEADARPARRVDCPPGRAWVLGADAYLLLAGAAAAAGRPTARPPGCSPRCAAATTGAWPALRRREESGGGAAGQSTSSASRAARTAPSEGTGR